VPEEEIDKRYYERPYYIAPNAKSGEEAFAVIRDAMKDKGRVALARIVFANREHIMAIEPWGKGLLGTTLRYDYEVRDERDAFKGIPSPRVPKEMVQLAAHILDMKSGHFDPAKFKDEYERHPAGWRNQRRDRAPNSQGYDDWREKAHREARRRRCR
jgi:DNA end-binding protein Ku